MFEFLSHTDIKFLIPSKKVIFRILPQKKLCKNTPQCQNYWTFFSRITEYWSHEFLELGPECLNPKCLMPECLTSLCTYPECLNVLTVSNFHQQRRAADKYSVQYTKVQLELGVTIEQSGWVLNSMRASL